MPSNRCRCCSHRVAVGIQCALCNAWFHSGGSKPCHVNAGRVPFVCRFCCEALSGEVAAIIADELRRRAHVREADAIAQAAAAEAARESRNVFGTVGASNGPNRRASKNWLARREPEAGAFTTLNAAAEPAGSPHSDLEDPFRTSPTDANGRRRKSSNAATGGWVIIQMEKRLDNAVDGIHTGLSCGQASELLQPSNSSNNYGANTARSPLLGGKASLLSKLQSLEQRISQCAFTVGDIVELREGTFFADFRSAVAEHLAFTGKQQLRLGFRIRQQREAGAFGGGFDDDEDDDAESDAPSSSSTSDDEATSATLSKYLERSKFGSSRWEHRADAAAAPTTKGRAHNDSLIEIVKAEKTSRKKTKHVDAAHDASGPQQGSNSNALEPHLSFTLGSWSGNGHYADVMSPTAYRDKRLNASAATIKVAATDLQHAEQLRSRTMVSEVTEDVLGEGHPDGSHKFLPGAHHRAHDVDPARARAARRQIRGLVREKERERRLEEEQTLLAGAPYELVRTDGAHKGPSSASRSGPDGAGGGGGSAVGDVANNSLASPTSALLDAAMQQRALKAQRRAGEVARDPGAAALHHVHRGTSGPLGVAAHVHGDGDSETSSDETGSDDSTAEIILRARLDGTMTADRRRELQRLGEIRRDALGHMRDHTTQYIASSGAKASSLAGPDALKSGGGGGVAASHAMEDPFMENNLAFRSTELLAAHRRMLFRDVVHSSNMGSSTPPPQGHTPLGAPPTEPGVKYPQYTGQVDAVAHSAAIRHMRSLAQNINVGSAGSTMRVSALEELTDED